MPENETCSECKTAEVYDEGQTLCNDCWYSQQFEEEE
jgi:uncharacterized Zn finger protein (UPF0148 family)